MMADFVLVHGAFHGGWCWERVTPRLQAAGHRVFTPTLAGLGDRANEADQDIGLGTHIQDVLDVIEGKDLCNVVLVGHSYAGMVISGVAARVPQRLAELVYLDACTPAPGQSLGDLFGPRRMQDWRERARRFGDGRLLPPPEGETFEITDPDDVDWVRSRLTPQPFRTFEDRLDYAWPAPPPFGLTCILCRPPGSAPRKPPGELWTYRELATGHDAMVTAPAALVRLLLACVA